MHIRSDRSIIATGALALSALAHPALAQFAPSLTARSWIEGEGATALFETAGGEAVGGEFSIPYPSTDYAPGTAVVYFNGDATANRLRNSYYGAGSTIALFLWNSMHDTYTISGPPGTEGAPVNARVIFRAAGTLFVGPTVSTSTHFGGSSVRIEMGTWGASDDPAFPEDFRVSPFDTSGNFLKSTNMGPSQNYGATQPELDVELVIDQVLVRTVGVPFDVAFGLDTTRNGAGNVRGVTDPADDEYIIATIDWELPPGYTITSVLGWTDPNAPACAGDINGDGDTNAADFTILAGNFGATVTPNTNGDLNGDGLVNAADFTILAGDFGCGS